VVQLLSKELVQTQGPEISDPDRVSASCESRYRWRVFGHLIVVTYDGVDPQVGAIGVT